MLSLGFGLASLFGIFLGQSFSQKQWKIKDFIILFAVFFAVDLIGKATLPHLILDLIQPQAVEVFEAGCKLKGIEGSAWNVYMQHFDDVSWAKKIIGGRNYFQSVEMITYAMKSVAVLLATRFVIKDKRAATTGFVVCGAFALSITVSDLFFYFGNGGYHELHESYLRQVAVFADKANRAGIIISLRLWNNGCDDGRNGTALEVLKEALPGQWTENSRGFRIRDKLFLEWGDRFDWPDQNAPEGGSSVYCHGLGDHFGILCDGTVVPCCLDSDGVIALGNVFREELTDILSSPRARAMAGGFRRRNATEDLCRRCGYARKF
jgi:hypothetical protein